MNSIYLIVHEKVQDCYAKNIIEKHDKIVFYEFNLKNTTEIYVNF
jgi:hypothetical protein